MTSPCGRVAVGLAPKLLLSQQAANPAPPPPAPVPWTLGLNPKTPLPLTEVVDGIAETDVQFFTSVQMASLEQLCDVLLPPLANKPGALQADTPRFLDFLIGNSPVERRHLYTGGLDWLEEQSQSRYKLPFARLNAAQVDALIQPWLRAWMTDHPPTERHADFINIAHEDILTATMNSKAWDDAAPAAGADWVTGGLTGRRSSRTSTAKARRVSASLPTSRLCPRPRTACLSTRDSRLKFGRLLTDL